jgi:lipid-binding SYLF domain-containing protein
MLVATIRPMCAFVFLTTAVAGCSTVPKAERQEQFLINAAASTKWFESSVSGLGEQIDASAGFIIFPDVSQWGILLAGGTFGRGAVCAPDGTQTGWAALNTGSLGLQAGVQGFRMLIVLENEQTLASFKANRWSGNMSGVAVAGTSGRSERQPFSNGVAIYEGANNGLMAGVQVGLDRIRFQPLAASESPGDLR